MTGLPFIDGFDLIALPRARRLTRSRQRLLLGWLGAGVCSGLLMLALDGVGTWRERAAARDHDRYRSHLQARVRALAPAWQDARHLTFSIDQATARKETLRGFSDRRWALHTLLDALARAATPGLALQQLRYHAEAQPRWPATPSRPAIETASRSRHRSLAAPLGALPAEALPKRDVDRIDAASGTPVPRDTPSAFDAALASGPQGVADAITLMAPADALEPHAAEGTFAMEGRWRADADAVQKADAPFVFADTLTEDALRQVMPHTAPLALTVEGMADDEAAVQGWIVRLQRDPRVMAVTVDAFTHESGRPTPLVWGSHTSARAGMPVRSGLTRFRVSVFGRSSTAAATAVSGGQEAAGVTRRDDILPDAVRPIRLANSMGSAALQTPVVVGVVR